MAEQRTTRTRREFGPLAVVVAGYLALATLFATVVPPFEAPDETGHLYYVNFVASRLRLPNQDNPSQRVEGEGHQFPLYYLIPALAVRAVLADNSVDLTPRVNRTVGEPDPTGTRPKFIHIGPSMFVSRSDAVAFYALRAYSMALGALTIVLCWFVAAELLPGDRQPLLAAALIACLPQFLFVSSSINNDNLANALITLATLYTLRLCRAVTSINAMLLGLAIGLALVTKKTALFLIPVVLLLCAWLVARNQRDRWQTTARLALTPTFVLACAGWIFARNVWIYGDPLATAMERRSLPLLIDERSLLDDYWMAVFVPQLGKSFVGVFGWMDVPLPALVPLFYLALGAVATIGLLLFVNSEGISTPITLALALTGSCFAGVVVYNLTYAQYQGRFMFPVVSVISSMAVLGLSTIAGRFVPGNWLARIGGALVALLVAIDVYALVRLHNYYSAVTHYI